MKADGNQTNVGNSRNYNLDLIKAICISLVLLWHLEPIDISIPTITAHSANLIFKQAQIALYFQVSLIAVPAFVITSLYLYMQKLNERGFPYFTKRIGYLSLITLFWIVCQSAFYYIFVATKSGEISAGFLPSSGPGWLSFFLLGGPSLPIVGGSVFYYLSALILLTGLSTLFVWASKWRWFEISASSLIVIASLLYFHFQELGGRYINSSTLENFLLYMPLAYFLQKNAGVFKSSVPVLLWTAYLGFSGWDLYLKEAGIPLNVYGRVSIACGAAALVASLINLKNSKASSPISFLSRHSLGIYALHKYFQYFMTLQLTPLFSLYKIRKKMPVGELMVNFQVLSIAVPTLLLTLAFVYILGKTPLKRFVL